MAENSEQLSLTPAERARVLKIRETSDASRFDLDAIVIGMSDEDDARARAAILRALSE
jgi:hypothetical protein